MEVTVLWLLVVLPLWWLLWKPDAKHWIKTRPVLKAAKQELKEIEYLNRMFKR